MENEILKYIDNYFNWLVEIHSFKKVDKINNGQTFVIQFNAEAFVITIESYRREFYCTLSKKDDAEMKIDLFNLLDYLKRNTNNIQKSNYFKNEKNIDHSYKKQIKLLSDIIYNNYSVIFNFFNQEKLDVQFAEIREFVIAKYPQLFKREKK